MMDNSDMELVEERNGFEVRIHPDSLRYRVHLPHYERSYIDDYATLVEAQAFCDENDANEWEDKV